jgi:hypothetical protein
LVFVKVGKSLGLGGIVGQDVITRRRSVQALEFIRVICVLDFLFSLWAVALLSVIVGMVVEGVDVTCMESLEVVGDSL